MADILIRGISIPRNCFECPLFTNCDACEGHECGCGLLGGIGYEEDISEDRRRDDCPLHELPEHGDLIDRGEIVAHYRKCECNLGSDRHLEFLTVHDWIEEGIVYDLLNAPVIVPASKEDLNTMDEFMRGQECGNPEDGSL